MERIVLSNKPLIEAIFELRWALHETPQGGKYDPHYKIVVGRVYDRVKDKYPFHEELPIARFPDEIAEYVVRHRFRKTENGWPLIQVGPGIITLNDTQSYIWEDFKERISSLLDVTFQTYSDYQNNLKLNGLILRYIDAIEFDYKKNDIFIHLNEKMKVNIEMYDKFFKETGVERTPEELDLRFSFPSAKPIGSAKIRFARGKRNGKDALLWETIVQNIGQNIPTTKEGISSWVEEAHNLTDDWFFKMIEGELLRRFQ